MQKLVRRFRLTGSVRDRPWFGRPRVTTARHDRYITLTYLCRRFHLATVTARRYGMTDQTVRKRVRSKTDRYGQILPRANLAAQINWCRRHLGFRHADWNTVMFTDGSKFNITNAAGRVRVYRRTGERFVDNVSLGGTDLGVEALWFREALWAVKRRFLS